MPAPLLTALPAIASVGMSIFGSKGPSRADMMRDLAPFKQGLDGQLNRINDMRDPNSAFWGQQQDSLLNQAYNSADFSNMLAGKMNFGTASGIQNQQNIDRTTQGVQGVGGLMSDAWLNLQKHTDDQYQNYLSGVNNYSQALTGITSAQHAQKQDRNQSIISGFDSLMMGGANGGKSFWEKIIGSK
jgi:hypothetical protein